MKTLLTAAALAIAFAAPAAEARATKPHTGSQAAGSIQAKAGAKKAAKANKHKKAAKKGHKKSA